MFWVDEKGIWVIMNRCRSTGRPSDCSGNKRKKERKGTKDREEGELVLKGCVSFGLVFDRREREG